MPAVQASTPRSQARMQPRIDDLLRARIIETSGEVRSPKPEARIRRCEMMQNQPRATMMLLAVAIFAMVPAVTSAAEVHTQGGVSYVSGGAGTEERDELDAMSG